MISISQLYRYRYSILIVLASSVFTVFGLSGFQKQHDDHASVMLNLLEGGGEADSFFAIPIYVFSFFDMVGVGAGVASILWGLLLIAYQAKDVVAAKDFLVVLFLLLPGPMLYLGMPSKELFFLTFLYLFLWSYRLGNKFSVLFLVIYSVLFRYYILIFPVFYYLSSRFFVLWVLLGLSLLIGFCYEEKLLEILWRIMYRRDISYDLHYFDVRSGWYNPISEYGWFSFFYNYMYAFLKLNFPILFEVTVKELYLQSYLLVIFYVIYAGRKCFVLVFPLIVMFFFYPLFEPDLGSYLRHLSSWYPVFIYLYFFSVSRMEASHG